MRVARPLAAAVAVAAICASLAPAPSRGQTVTSSILFDDYGFTQRLAPGARAAALGGAFVAIGDDTHSLVYNPAGLARIKRIEMGMGIHQERIDVGTDFYGTSVGVDKRAGGFESISIAVPLPTYRGGFVAALGVYRVYSGFFDLHYRGDNEVDETRDNYLLQQSGALYSYNAGFGVDLSPTLSGGFSLFIIDGTIDRLEQYDYTFTSVTPRLAEFVTDDRVLDVTGFGARVGAQFYFQRHVQAGFMFQAPTLINTAGKSFTQITRSVENGIDTFTEFEGSTDSEFVLPFQLEIGVAASVAGATLSMQMGYADWTEAAIDRKRLRAQTLETVFREVIDYRIGLEYTVPRFPLRLRAGFARRPHPLKFVQGDRIDEEQFTRAEFPDERRQFSAGVGGLVGSVMTIDAAWTRTEGERTLPYLVDDRVVERFLLTAAYRF